MYIHCDDEWVSVAHALYACIVLHRLRSPVGPMTMKEQQLEGKLRYVNSRVITNRYTLYCIGCITHVFTILLALHLSCTLKYVYRLSLSLGVAL